MQQYLGIDVGTSGCRACVIDDRAAILAEAAVELPSPLARNGGSEQDAALWWRALCRMLDELSGSTPLDRVAAISLDGTGIALYPRALGDCLAAQKKWADAKAAYERALTLDPADAAAKAGLKTATAALD